MQSMSPAKEQTSGIGGNYLLHLPNVGGFYGFGAGFSLINWMI